MDRSIRIEKTADGSTTLYLPEMDEHYHSINGALQESIHVFIESGLRSIQKKEISILEIGFGTGLNAYLSLLEVSKLDIQIHYTGYELYPLPSDIVSKTNYSQLLSSDQSDLFSHLHAATWEIEAEITPNFFLTKKHLDFVQLNDLEENETFDLIYYDAFAPDKQTDMWSQDIFDYLYTHTSIEGKLVTYCAKGSVRRMLQQAGYFVERLPGPIGKREMLRATKISE